VIPGVCRLALQHDVTRNDVIREGRQTDKTSQTRKPSVSLNAVIFARCFNYPSFSTVSSINLHQVKKLNWQR